MKRKERLRYYSLYTVIFAVLSFLVFFIFIKNEYMELDTEPQEQKNPAVGEVPERDILVGDIVQHFKREWVSSETSEYLYKVLAFAQHTETGEKLVVYQGMYPPFKICARPYDMFMSEVDREKYPKIRQKYRFEKIKL